MILLDRLLLTEFIYTLTSLKYEYLLHLNQTGHLVIHLLLCVQHLFYGKQTELSLLLSFPSFLQSPCFLPLSAPVLVEA